MLTKPITPLKPSGYFMCTSAYSAFVCFVSTSEKKTVIISPLFVSVIVFASKILTMAEASIYQPLVIQKLY